MALSRTPSGSPVQVNCTETLPITIGSGQSVTLHYGIPANASEPSGDWLGVYVVLDAYYGRTGTESTTTFGASGANGAGLIAPPAPGSTSPYTFSQPNDGNSTTILHSYIQLYPHDLPQVALSPDTLNQSHTITICQGSKTTLNWLILDVASATLVDGSGNSVPIVIGNPAKTYPTEAQWQQGGNSVSLSASVSPEVQTTYTMTVVGFGGETATSSLTVKVIPFSVTLTADTAAVVANQPVTLTWTSVGASYVQLSVEQPLGSTPVTLDARGSSTAVPAQNKNAAGYPNAFGLAIGSYPNGWGYPADCQPSGSMVIYPQASCKITAIITSSGSCGTRTSVPVQVTVTYSVDGSTAALSLMVFKSLSSPSTPAAPPPPSVSSLFLTEDAHRRPLAARADPAAATGALGCWSNDAGHSFGSSVIDADLTCADLCLLVDRKQNRFSALYTKTVSGKAALCSAFGPITDAFTPDAAPAAAGVSGAYPICAQHPTDRDFTLMLLLSGGALISAQSADYGRTWTAGGSLAGGLDFSASGRAGVAWLGETAFAVYASGNSLVCAQSLDRGLSWIAPTHVPPAVASAGPYSGISLLGWQGTLYVLAFSGSPAAATLLRSGGDGTPWASAGTLPSIAPPSAIGVLPLLGQLRLGLTHKSDSDGASWLAD